MEVIDCYIQAPAIIDYCYSFGRIVSVYDDPRVWNPGVLKDGKFEGMISKSRLYSE